MFDLRSAIWNSYRHASFRVVTMPMPALNVKPAGACRLRPNLRSAKSCSASIPATAASAPTRAVPGVGRRRRIQRRARHAELLRHATPPSCTAFADNDVGRLVEDFILQGGVDTSTSSG